MGFIAAIAGALITSAISYYFSQRSSEEAFTRQNELLDKQLDATSIPTRVQQMKDAGINPTSAVLGSGSLNVSAPSGSPGVVAPTQVPDFSSALMNLMHSELFGQQSLSEKSMRDVRIEEIQKQINYLDTLTEKTGLDAANQQILNKYTAALQELAVAGGKIKLKLDGAQIANLKAGTRRLQFEIDKVLPEEVQRIISERKINVLRLDEVIAVTKDYYASIGVKEKQGELYSAQTETEKQQQALLQSQTDLTDEQASKYAEIQNALIAVYGAQVKDLSAKAGLTEEQTFWYLFQLYSNNRTDVRLGPVSFGTTPNLTTNPKKVDEEYRRRYGK